jgi:hypothetical protein
LLLLFFFFFGAEIAFFAIFYGCYVPCDVFALYSFLLQMDARGVRELFARVISAIALCVREEEVGIELYDSVDFGALFLQAF